MGIINKIYNLIAFIKKSYRIILIRNVQSISFILHKIDKNILIPAMMKIKKLASNSFQSYLSFLDQRQIFKRKYIL